MRVLVTGGCGYIGSHTCVELLESGHEVFVLDNLSNSTLKSIEAVKKITKKDVKVYIDDVHNKDKLIEIMQDEKIHACIHFAAFKAADESFEKEKEYYYNNVEGTRCLIEAMVTAQVKKLVFSSTAAVYGNKGSGIYCEDMETDPLSPYAKTKLICENMIKESTQANDISAVVFRYFNVAGAHKSGDMGEQPNGMPKNLIPAIAMAANRETEFVKIYGMDYDTKDGTCIRDFIHVVDLAKAHVSALEYLDKEDNPKFDIFNVGTGKITSVLDTIKAFEKASGVKINYKVYSNREGDPVFSCANIDKISKRLLFKAENDIEDICLDTWRWKQKHPYGYREISLVIMAAGMGSRFGGLKQITPLGPKGQIILDYSIEDALKAGFDKIVIVIKEENQKDFDNIMKNKACADKISYVYQSLDKYTDKEYVRQKPWGTAHAVLCAMEKVRGPFGVINADDYYGKGSFEKLYEFLNKAKPYEYGLIAYKLKNTLTDNGTVSRGVCKIENGILQEIKEILKIKRSDGKAVFENDGRWDEIDEETYVSMNMFGFGYEFFEFLKEDFKNFLKENPNGEYQLPTEVSKQMQKGECTVYVMPTDDIWTGVTYKEDIDKVREILSRI